MNRSRARRGALALLAPLFLILSLPLGSFADVVLNEVLADPISDWSGDGIIDFKNDEWVEIANRGDSPENLGGYWISDAVGDPAVRYRFEGILAPGEAFHVTGAMAVAWQAETGNGSAGLSLSNSGGDVALFRDEGAASVLADSVAYLAYQVDDNRSLGRADGVTGEWILYDGFNLYHGNQLPGSTGCLPTPGEANRCDEVAADGSTWSQVKDRYPSN